MQSIEWMRANEWIYGIDIYIFGNVKLCFRNIYWYTSLSGTHTYDCSICPFCQCDDGLKVDLDVGMDCISFLWLQNCIITHCRALKNSMISTWCDFEMLKVWETRRVVECTYLARVCKFAILITHKIGIYWRCPLLQGNCIQQHL